MVRMSEFAVEECSDFQQLLRDLQQLLDEQRAVDLRDPEAFDACQRKIAALRQKLVLLNAFN